MGHEQTESDLQQAQQIYTDINKRLLRDIPALVSMRTPYLEPCFEAFVKNQLVFHHEAASRFDAVKRSFEYGGKSADGYGVEGQSEMVLQQMRQLTICGAGNASGFAQ
jgi:bridging integrator 3